MVGLKGFYGGDASTSLLVEGGSTSLVSIFKRSLRN